MRIFKNRGDIFFSKTNREKSAEQKILLFALVFIVAFTVVFVMFTAVKNDFSAKTFFKPENIQTTAEQGVENELILPQVSGKSNYVIMVSEEKNLLFAYLLQVDMDSVSYKITALSPNTKSNGKALADIFKYDGAENTKIAVEELIGTDFDYYISFERDKFIELFNDFGDVKYPIIDAVKYKDNQSAVAYSVRIKEGEQSIKGSDAVNLVRYYVDNSKHAQANDLLLTCLANQVNQQSYDNREVLFGKFIKSAQTNITVKDFTNATDSLLVLSYNRTGVSIYNAPVKYENNKISKDSLNEIKGYYSK